MGKSHRAVQLVALLTVLVLVGSACSSKKTETGGLKKGGILRLQTDGFEWNANMDPTAEYLGFAIGIHSNLLSRALMGYRHVDAAKGGNEPLPDLADGMPTVSADGLTYTFKIKKNVKFSPPVNRAVTSKDVKYAFIRIANDTLSAGGYPSYYLGIIKGMDHNVTDISGITTPDDNTIVFTLTKPTGDFLFRLSMSATVPIPEEVAKCSTKNGEYGRHQVSSGPYMIMGADDPTLKAGDCASLKPLAGFDPTAFLKIRRNPNYDASTDSKEQRENLIDGLDLTLNTNTDDIFNKIAAGQIDGESATPPGATLQKYSTDATLKDRLKIGSGDRTWYIFMNMTKAPFDDVHVRKAVNFIMDKPALIRARGGPTVGVPAEHIVPPPVLQNKLGVGEFDPYASPNHAGDVAKAMAEIKLSKYDANHDGICDAAACKNVLHITRATPPYPDMEASERAQLKKIGIILAPGGEVASFYKTVQVTSLTPPIGSGAGWGKDYADASTFFIPLLSSGAISKDATQNYALLGLTKAQATSFGVKNYPAAGVPTIDPDIDICQAKSGDERATCWADLDKHLMNDIVPWVPYLWANNVDVISSAVVKYEFDQFPGEGGYAHYALDTSKQVAG